MPKYAARSDSNQQEIMDALRAAGASVRSIHREGKGVPDLLVGHNRQNFIMEIKSAKGQLTPSERKFIANWNGWVDIVRSIEDALKAIGRL